MVWEGTLIGRLKVRILPGEQFVLVGSDDGEVGWRDGCWRGRVPTEHPFQGDDFPVGVGDPLRHGHLDVHGWGHFSGFPGTVSAGGESQCCGEVALRGPSGQ